jgi:hypothetical protein
MLKKKVLAVFVGLALLGAVVGSSGIVAEWLGVEASPAHACNDPASSGGGC